MSFGPADLAASRRMKTTRVGGGHPGYRVIDDPDPDDPEAPRRHAPSRTRGTTRSRAWSTPARRPGSCPFYGPYGDIRDVQGCETQFRAAFLLGCVGAWSLHPVQIEIAKKVFSPDPDEVRFAKKVLEAIPDGRGVHMIDGKMQDDATWKQCKVMVSLAEMLAAQGPGAGRGVRVRARRGVALRMRISAKADYAVRAAVELAAARRREAGQGRADRHRPGASRSTSSRTSSASCATPASCAATAAPRAASGWPSPPTR